MENKIKIELGRVQETLLLPLVSRAKETEYKNPLLNDTKAVELFKQLDVDRKKLLRNITEIGVHGLCYRAYKMDEAIKEFLQKHPNGKILDIGDVSNGLFITIPGVLPYFKEEDVKAFLTTIAPKLKGAELIFDVISQFGKFFVDMRIKRAGMKEAHLEWGILNPDTVTQWSNHIELVRTIKFFDAMPKSNQRISTKLAMRFNKVFDMTQMFHLRFV